jgi:hemolysin III
MSTRMSRSGYSRAERLSDAVVHVAGLALVLAAVPVLIVVTALVRGDAPSLAGVSVYAAGLVLMIGASAAYNIAEGFSWGAARAWLLRRIDHAAIYLKIAATYTPFALISGHGLAVTVGVWVAALAGVALKIASPERFRWVGLALYLGMGWAGVLAGGALIAALPGPVILLMATGGVLYTAGVVFYVWERLPFHLTVWHGFVLAASLVFYAAVMVAVVLPESGFAAA